MSSSSAASLPPSTPHEGDGSGEPLLRVPEPPPQSPERAPVHVRERIDDRALMAVLIPGFGIAIAHATGVFGELGPASSAWWWGHLWFVGGAGLIYGANRTLLFAGRAHADWFRRPVARLVLLATGILFGTLPTTLLMLHFWSVLSGVVLTHEVQTVLLVNVICVLFVTWLYEMLFLIRERVDDQVRLTEVSAARARAELAALRAQVDPHFLFNALNTLAALVETRPPEARQFVDHLAHVYRALLDTRGLDTVPLSEELALAEAYAGLLRIRYGGAVVTEVIAPPDPARWRVPPGTAQVLLENVVRHNAIDPDVPLPIELDASAGTLVVHHPRRPRSPSPGAGLGLANLDARTRAATGRSITVHDGDVFRVAVPMVAV